MRLLMRYGAIILKCPPGCCHPKESIALAKVALLLLKYSNAPNADNINLPMAAGLWQLLKWMVEDWKAPNP